MRPLKLSVQGFTCFREHTELDFADMELYAIQGATGSGKSSLLDAMCFALYGSTPRLGSKGMDALISQGERGLTVSLEFEVGGERYRVARARGRRQSENELRLEQFSDGRYLSLTDTKVVLTQAAIERVLGLDFDAFTRAVLLPQGEFGRFLRGSGKERQELLGALLNMAHVKRMAEVAGEKSRELGAKLKGTHALLDGEYADISEARLAGWKAEGQAAEFEAARLTAERETLGAELARLRQQEEHFQAREAAARQLADLDARAAAVLAGAGRAASARRVAGVLPLLDAAARAGEAAERAGRELATRQAALDQSAAALKVTQQHLHAAQQAAERSPDLQARADALKEAEADLRRLKLAGGTVTTSHADPLPWDEEAHHAAREAAQKLDQVRLERVQLDAARASIGALKTRIAADEAQQRESEAELERVKADGVRIKDELDSASEGLKVARERAGLAAHRAHLHVGAPCPLCEQTVAALPAAPAEDLSALSARVQGLERTRDGLRERFADLRAAGKARAAKLERDRAELVEWETSTLDREKAVRAQESALTGDPHATVQRLLAGLAARVRQAGADPAGERGRLLTQIEDARRRLDDARATAARAESALAAAQASFEAAQAVQAGRASEAAEAATRLQGALAALGLNAKQARSQALPESEIQALETAHRQLQAGRERLLAALAELERKLGAAPYDPARLRAAERELAAAEAALTGARQRIGALAEQLRAGEQKLARKGELEAEATRLAAQFDTWAALAQSLKANEFQQYLLQEVEAQLLTRAGALLFEISDGRYRLTLEGSEYSVQDLWNAGETRGVRTLSGGETFLASLALAIALSDYLAGNRVLGALFLDEGFGTLDPQALEAVAGALESLRTQGRMVGVITHVESLSERLPARILVSKSVAGSRAMRMDG